MISQYFTHSDFAAETHEHKGRFQRVVETGVFEPASDSTIVGFPYGFLVFLTSFVRDNARET
jgi:hypothetical protein